MINFILNITHFYASIRIDQYLQMFHAFTTYIFLNIFFISKLCSLLACFSSCHNCPKIFPIYILKNVYVSRFVHFIPICSRIMCSWTAKFTFSGFSVVHITLDEKFLVSFLPKANLLSMHTWASSPTCTCEIITPSSPEPPAMVMCFLMAYFCLWLLVSCETESMKYQPLYTCCHIQ